MDRWTRLVDSMKDHSTHKGRMMVNAYGEHVGGGERPWQLDVIERLVEQGEMRYCDVCGKPYKPKCDTMRYCSFACRMEANRYRARQAKRKELEIRRKHREKVLR